MRRIEIADQVRLSLARVTQLTMDGIRYRIFRTSVTVAIVTVAVAFLMNIMSEGILTRAVARATRAQIAEMRRVHIWSARLTSPGTPDSIIADLAAAQEGGPEYFDIVAMTGWTPLELRAFQDAARQAAAYLSFFEQLDYGRRRNLVGAAAGTEILDRLTTPAGWVRFEKALGDMSSVRFVTSIAAFRTLLAQWPAQREAIRKLQRGRADAIAVVDGARGGRPILEMLAGADVAFGSAVRAAGFRLYTAETAPLLAEQARRILDRQRMEQSAGQPALRTLIGQHFRVEPSSVNASLLWKMVSTPSGAERYLSAMKKAGEATAGLQPERVVQLAALVTDEARLTRTAQMTLNAGSGWMGLGPRMGWLLLVSMLVCGIGICNAMLMTVTERFREIATLKCLGALDETIMLMFVLESCLLGSVGGCCGAILGSVIGLGRMLAAFGASAARSLPAAGMLMGMAAAVGAGIVLAAIAAVYPAFRAARLAPMEAMRIE